MKRTFPTDSPRNSPRKSPRRSPFVPKQTASIESSPRSSPRRKAAINALVAISSPAKSSLSKELVLSSATEESQPQSKPQDENNDTEQFELVNFDDQENTTTNLSREKKRKKDRKSLGRRVSFAAAAHIRLFDKDENPWSNGTPKKSDNLLGGSNGIRFDEELEYGEGGNWQFELPDLNSIGRRSIGNAFDLRLSLDGAKLQTQEEAAEETAAPEPANLSVHSELESEAIQSSFDIPLKEPAEMPSILESHQGDTSTEEESNAPAVVADERDNIFVSSSAELSPASTNMNAENYELTRFSEVSMDLGDHISAIYGDNSVEADDTNMEITACYGGIQNQSADLITSQSQGYSFSPDEFLELSEAHQQDSPNAAAPRLSEVPLPDADKLTQELADDITETISTYMNDFRQEMSEAITEGITDYVHKIMEEENLENNDTAEHVEVASGAKHGEITEYIQQNQNQQQQQWEQQQIVDQEDSVPPSPTGMEFTTHHGGIESQQMYQDEQDERLASSFLVDILTRDALVDGDIHGEHFTTYADSPNQYQDSPYRVSQASTMQQFHESPAFSVDERFLPASQGSTPYRMSTQSSAQKPTSRRNTPGSSLNARSWAMNGEQSMPVTQQATPSRLPSQMTHQERQSRTNTPGSVMSARYLNMTEESAPASQEATPFKMPARVSFQEQPSPSNTPGVKLIPRDQTPHYVAKALLSRNSSVIKNAATRAAASVESTPVPKQQVTFATPNLPSRALSSARKTDTATRFTPGRQTPLATPITQVRAPSVASSLVGVRTLKTPLKTPSLLDESPVRNNTGVVDETPSIARNYNAGELLSSAGKTPKHLSSTSKVSMQQLYSDRTPSARTPLAAPVVATPRALATMNNSTPTMNIRSRPMSVAATPNPTFQNTDLNNLSDSATRSLNNTPKITPSPLSFRVSQYLAQSAQKRESRAASASSTPQAAPTSSDKVNGSHSKMTMPTMKSGAVSVPATPTGRYRLVSAHNSSKPAKSITPSRYQPAKQTEKQKNRRHTIAPTSFTMLSSSNDDTARLRNTLLALKSPHPKGTNLLLETQEAHSADNGTYSFAVQDGQEKDLTMNNESAILEDSFINDMPSAPEPEPLPKVIQPISLKEFLTMTDIAFAEITESTKPRPNAPEDENPACTGDYVKASSVLVPELELLIFACRELSDYISEGKSTLQKFEEEIDTNNPPLIGQYLHETPGVQEFMKSQLVTTRQYAQLKAKEGWYDWRDKLIAQLNGVLRLNLEQLKKDHKSVGDFSQRVATLLPELQGIRDQLEKTFESEREEYNAMIQKEENLMKSLQNDISDTTAKFNDTVTGIYKLEQDKKKMQEQLALLKQEKEQLQKEISESQQICEESKFLTSSDLVQLKERYEWLSTLHGWKIAKLLHSTILMTYKDMLQVKLSVSSDGTLELHEVDVVEEAFASKFKSVSQARRLIQNLSSVLSAVTVNEALHELAAQWDSISVLLQELTSVARCFTTEFDILNGTVLQVTVHFFNTGNTKKEKFSVRFLFDIPLSYPIGEVKFDYKLWCGDLSLKTLSKIMNQQELRVTKIRSICERINEDSKRRVLSAL